MRSVLARTDRLLRSRRWVICSELAVASGSSAPQGTRWLSAVAGSSDIGHPVVDVTPILRPGDPGRAAAVSQIGSALRERGYFYAQNVDVLSASYITEVYDYSRQLHNLPRSVKEVFAQRDGHGAYSGQDIGQSELAYDPGTVATVRGWDYSRTRFTLTKDGGQGDDSQKAGNQYPDGSTISPPYVEFMDALYERQNILGHALMGAFAECLGLPSRTFQDMCIDNAGGDFGTIRLLSYPGSSSEAVARANVGISAHTDFEAFTLMHQDAPGLQFIPASGQGWIDAPVRPGEFVVIVGDVLERFTNGVLRSTPHRVVLTPHPRMSIIRFNAVTPETIVSPLPEFVTRDRPAAYTPVTMRKHMETTMRNLEAGIGAWDEKTQTSLTATYVYQ